MDVEIIGYIGGSIASSSMVVQVVKSYKQRSVSNFSWAMLLLNSTGCILMIIYAFLIDKPAIYSTVLVSLLCFFIIIGMKLYYENYKKMNITHQNDKTALSISPV